MNAGSRSLLALLALALLTGCASHHRQTAHFPDQSVAVEDPSRARIYVMRRPTFWRFNLVVLTRSIRVLDGSDEIGSIAGARGFLSWEREPGELLVSVPGEASIRMTVEMGKVYYIVVRDVAGLDPGGVDRMSVELEVVDRERGRKDLSEATPPDDSPRR